MQYYGFRVRTGRRHVFTPEASRQSYRRGSNRRGGRGYHCPLWLSSLHMRQKTACPLYSQYRPRKQTFALGDVCFTPESGHVRCSGPMSTKGQKRTSSTQARWGILGAQSLDAHLRNAALHRKEVAMTDFESSIVTSADGLRALYAQPSERVAKKPIDHV